MDPLARSVASRFATRPIWLDKQEVVSFVGRLTDEIVQWAKRQPQDEPIGNAKGIAHDQLYIDEADGRSGVRIDVYVEARASKAAFAAVLSGQARGSEVTLFLNGAMKARELTPEWSSDRSNIWDNTRGRLQPLHSCRYITCLPFGLYSTLIHELTHAADSRFIKDLTYSPSEVREKGEAAWGSYVNDPAEVRAFMQEIVDDAVHTAKNDMLRSHAAKKPNPNQAIVDLALKLSTTWKLIEGHLTTANRTKMLKAVYDGLERHGLLMP
jgi:hypothetical protein